MGHYSLLSNKKWKTTSNLNVSERIHKWSGFVAMTLKHYNQYKTNQLRFPIFRICINPFPTGALMYDRVIVRGMLYKRI